uniref:WD repeat domain, phosphoinositide interacting 1 n=1 Tax=Myripristis murdjan TaxID=586833 RepID=A0A668A6N4_9TELE
LGCTKCPGPSFHSFSRIHDLSPVPVPVECPDVYIVERLFSSSLVVVVSLSMPRRMNVYHFKKGTEICNYSYSNNILSVRLNRQRLVVCLEESIYIHNIKDMKLLKTLLNTPSNPSGLCALSVNHSNSYLAYPGNPTIGEIIVYDANNLSAVTLIQAHDSPLAALTFNASGTKLASASEKGTVIRVFTIPEGQKLFEFRRGMKRYVSISSLSFSADAQFLCASSNTETVHIFKLEQHRVPHMVGIRRENVHGGQHLPAHSGVRHDAPGQSLCNRATQHVRPEEHLRPHYDPETPSPAGGVLRWASVHLQRGPTGWRGVCPRPETQVCVCVSVKQPTCIFVYVYIKDALGNLTCLQLQNVNKCL